MHGSFVLMCYKNINSPSKLLHSWRENVIITLQNSSTKEYERKK